MLCDVCHQREATHHLISEVDGGGPEKKVGVEREQHFCDLCLDTYFTATPGMSAMRGLVCLSDSYRSKLYDLLAASHPEVFYGGEDLTLNERAASVGKLFLREQLQKEGLEFNEEAFAMLWFDFMCSRHFYTRRDEYNRDKG